MGARGTGVIRTLIHRWESTYLDNKYVGRLSVEKVHGGERLCLSVAVRPSGRVYWTFSHLHMPYTKENLKGLEQAVLLLVSQAQEVTAGSEDLKTLKELKETSRSLL